MSHQMKYQDSLVDTGGYQNYLPVAHYDFFPGIVWICDVHHGDISYLSRGITDILGYSPTEFKQFSANWSSIVLDEDLAPFTDFMQRLLHSPNQRESTATFRFNHKQGGYKYLRTTGAVVEAKMGCASRVIFFFQNVTDQVHLEDESLATRRLFDETEKLILCGSWTWHAATGKVALTQGMYELLEFETDEIGVIDADFFTRHILPEFADNLRSVVVNAIATQSDFEAECIIKTRSGKEKYIYTRGKPILDNNGNLNKYIGITRDVTNKKNAEKDHERRIRELDRSNKELEEFAYVASHDMHEPLRKVLTFGEKINNKYSAALGDDGKVYLDRIVSSAYNMRNLIDNLLEFSRISRGTRAFVTTDLNEIVGQVMSDQELRIEETGTTLKVRELPVIEGVPSELRQLFNNLISNAIKFRKKEISPVITITSHKLTHKEKSEYLIPFNQTYHRISIQDNGIGFESVYSEKIFEIFQRLNGKSEYTGSGIGLSICKKIVESHDGIIYATSEPAVGSTFSIILPEIQYH
jgi:PAS domain S-box-containing protein